MNDDVDLDLLFKRLHLANARRVWRDMIQRAEKESWSYRDLLAVLVAEEIAQRQQTRLARLSRHAGFPFLKTVDDFDFTYQSTLRLALLGSALSPDFVTEGRCLILRGKPGRGKTHLAVAIAYRAIQNGFDALFTTAAELSAFAMPSMPWMPLEGKECRPEGAGGDRRPALARDPAPLKAGNC